MAETSGDAVREISIEEFDEMIENHDDLLIMDVREIAEFRRGHTPGALQISLEILERATDDANRARVNGLLEARQKLLVLCSQDGSCCAATANKLQKMGFEKVYSLAGGINRWEAQGFALVRE